MSKIDELRQRLAKLEELRGLRRVKNPPAPTWADLARPNQLMPAGNWHVWFICAGRGFGKTRSGSEWIVDQAEQNPKTDWAVVGPVWLDTKTIPMAAVESVLESRGYKKSVTRAGLASGTKMYCYNESDLKITLHNGANIKGYTADKPDRLRGPNFSGAWCDELAAFKQQDYLWNDCLVPAVRIGEAPRILVTTTPKPTPLIKELIERDDGSVCVVTGSTYDNAANLSPAVLEELRKRYEGTRRGRQELYGQLLLDAEFALWNRDMIEAAQLSKPVPPLLRTVVSVDPSGSAGGDATGIVTAGIDRNGIIYILSDDTCNGSPDYRYKQVCTAVSRSGAGTILYEGAYGGDNIAHGIRLSWKDMLAKGEVEGPVPLLKVSPTKSSKADRAHPVVALYEQTLAGMTRVQHAVALPELEDEMVQWEPSSSWSPNRMDALVHAVRFLAPYLGSSSLSSPLRLPALPALPIG